MPSPPQMARMARPRFTVTPFTAWNGALRTCPVRNRHHDHVDDNHRIDRIQRSARPLGGCTGGLLRDLADGVWRPSPPQTSSKCAAISPVINPRGQQQYDLIDPVQTAHALEHDHLSPRQQQGPNRNHRGWRKFGPCGGVEHRGFEPLTFSLRTRRATNCANAPNNAVTLPHPGNPRHGRDSVDKDLVSSGLFRLLGDVIKGCAHVLDHRLDV